MIDCLCRGRYSTTNAKRIPRSAGGNHDELASDDIIFLLLTPLILFAELLDIFQCDLWEETPIVVIPGGRVQIRSEAQGHECLMSITIAVANATTTTNTITQFLILESLILATAVVVAAAASTSSCHAATAISTSMMTTTNKNKLFHYY